MLTNQEIAQILNNIADILEFQEVSFKPFAYRRVAQYIESLEEDLRKIYKDGKLRDLPGVGEHIGKKIEEIITTGKLKYYDKLKKSVKVDIENLNKIPSLGPKRIKFLYTKLKIKTVRDLEKAIKKNKIQDLDGFGKKSEYSILKGIEFVKTFRRISYKEAVPIAKKLKRYMEKFPLIKKIDLAGSFRRKKNTIGDLDILVVSSKPLEVMGYFKKFPDVKDVLMGGLTKTSVRLKNGLQVDLRVVKLNEYGAALLYFTGSKHYNIELRKKALKLGYTLNEYSLSTLDSGEWVAGRTEREILKKLGLRYSKPEERDI